MSADDEGLRVRVATVLGLEIPPIPCTDDHEKYAVNKLGDVQLWKCRKCDCWTYDGGLWQVVEGREERLPDFPNSLDAAFQLIEHLREKGLSVEISNEGPAGWKVTIFHTEIFEEGDKLAPTICNAFLAVMEPTTEGVG
jgi:ribosomal protein L37AE/L43A